MSSACFWTDAIGCQETCPLGIQYQGNTGNAGFMGSYNANTGAVYYGVYLGAGQRFDTNCARTATWSSAPNFTRISLVSVRLRCFVSSPTYSTTQQPWPAFVVGIAPCYAGPFNTSLEESVVTEPFIQDFTVLNANVDAAFTNVSSYGGLWERTSLLAALGHSDALTDLSNTKNALNTTAVVLMDGSGTPYDGYYICSSIENIAM